MKKLLSLLGSVSMIGTAGATVVACGNEKASESIPEVSKQSLVDTINEANKLIANNKNLNPNAEANLKISIADAQRVVDSPDVDQLQVDTATSTLKAAIVDFQNETKTDYSGLEATVNEAKEAIENKTNPNEEAEKSLNEAITVAQKIIADNNSSQSEVNDEAIPNLKNAIEAFKEATATDFSELEATIAKAEEVKASSKNHDEEADKALTEAINVAQKVIDEAKATQEEVVEAVEELTQTIEVFQELTATDYSELENTINKAEEVKANPKNYKEEADKALTEAINVAQKVIDENQASQDEVAGDVQKLETAIVDFQKATATNKTILFQTITSSIALIIENDNPNANEQLLSATIKKAQVIAADEEVTQDQVEAVNKELEEAFILFKQQQAKHTKYEVLKTKIEEANTAIANNKNPDEEAESALKTIIKLAQSLVDENHSSQTVVDDHVKLLTTGIKKFQEATKTNYTKLEASITAAEEAIKNNVNPNAPAEGVLKADIKISKDVLKTDATQDTVNKTATKLDKAVKNFKEATDTNYSGLTLIIKEAHKVLTNNTNPNVDEKALQVAIDEAQAIVDKADSSQTQVDTAIISLAKAIKEFNNVAPTDYSQLTAKITEAEQAIEDNVNPNAPAEGVLKLAIELSKVIWSANSTQDSVDEAVINLAKAIENFKEATDTNYSDLKNKISAANGLLEFASSPNADKVALQAAIDEAQTIVDTKVTQKEVDSALIKLEAAIIAFTKTDFETDNSALKAKIIEANEIKNATKHPNANGARWILDEVIAFAQSAVNKETTISQKEVDSTEIALEKAIEKFQKATKGESLEKVLEKSKKLWFDDESFAAFSEDKLDSAKMAEMVWTGMLDARYVGNDESEAAKTARENSLKEFKEKNLASVISFEAKTANIGLEQAKEFAQKILDKGNSYLNRGLTLDKLVDAVADLKKSLENDNITTSKLLKATSKTASAIKHLKEHFAIEEAEESFDLVVKTNENIKLTLKEELVAYFTSGEEVKSTLVGEGSATFPDLTFVLTI